MKNKVYTFLFKLDWELLRDISHLDQFIGSWKPVELSEKKSLTHLRAIATVQSVGASTRIEGSKMTDDEVNVLIRNLSISHLEERDQQEVAGYFEVLDIITESYTDIDISENTIKHLHSALMKYNKKDEWHKGSYKQLANVVQASNAGMAGKVIYHTTAPGFATEDAMRNLLEWYKDAAGIHPIVRAAVFVYDFLSIHPFQDGNGRLSRILTTLLLLKSNYSWVEYISFEHEIESRKAEYYNVLMQCQAQRPVEDIYPWVKFFLSCLKKMQTQLLKDLSLRTDISTMPPKQKKIYHFIQSNEGCSSGKIAIGLNIPLPTVKKLLSAMVAQKLIVRFGLGTGTNYAIAGK